MFKYIRNFIFVFRLTYRSLKITYRKMKDPDLKELTGFRHVLVVGEKVKDCPQLVVARVLDFYEEHPSKEMGFKLRDEILSDDETCKNCHFEGNPTHHDLVVMYLGHFSEAMISGLLGEEHENVDG